MCIGIPMQVMEAGEFFARCRGRHGEARLDMRLLDPQPAGSWVLAFADTARESLTPERAAAIDAALDALADAMTMPPGPASSARADGHPFDAFFPDLAQRAPELPEFLRPPAPSEQG
jgi:hydrogenase expression/formation protein HypC